MTLRYKPRLSIRLIFSTLVFIWLCYSQIATASGPTYFVNQNASGLSNGQSWENAFNSLQDALDVAEAGDSIWVAAGVYKPSKRSDEGRARTETFLLIEGVELFGGFQGDESAFEDRDWETHQTILSGDIDSNDVTVNGITLKHSDILGENAFHVVTGDRTLTYTVATVLDGFVVTGGLTEDARNTNHSEGGGITFQSNASPTLRNLWVVGNKSPQDDGGGIHFLNNNKPILENIIVESNRAGDHGGGLFFEDDNAPSLEQITLLHNEADKTASLYMHKRNTAILVNLNFCGNFNDNSGNPKIGAGFSIESDNVIQLHNGVFAANVNAGTGGGLRMNSNNLVELKHVSMSGNRALDGGAIYIRGSGNIVDLANSILWGNSSEIVSQGLNEIDVQSSLIGADTEPYIGINNLASTVMPFVMLPDSGNDLEWGTSDDECGDLSLRQSSVAKDGGDNALIPADELDIDHDLDVSEPLSLDGKLRNRIYSSTVDLGAFEVSVDPLDQAIIFELPADADDGMAINQQTDLTATASSNLEVDFETLTPSICSISGTTATMIAGGVCTIEANQQGDGTFSAASEVAQDIFVSDPLKTDQIIHILSPLTGSNLEVLQMLELAATATSSLPVAFTSKTPGTCTLSGSQLVLDQVGTCLIEAIQVGDETYNPAPKALLTLTIKKIEQSILMDRLPDTLPADGGIDISAEATSGLPISIAVSSPDICSIVAKRLTMLTSGDCIIHGNQDGNEIYAAAQEVAHTITVTKIGQTISFFSPIAGAEFGVGDESILSASASSGLDLSFSTTTTSICSLTDDRLKFLAEGSCNIVANQLGNGIYAAAQPVSHQFEVIATSKDDQSIEILFPAENDAFRIGDLILLEAVATSGLRVSFESLTPSSCTVGGNVLITNHAGLCKIQATQDGDNKNEVAAHQVLSIFVKQDQSIHFITSPAAHRVDVGDIIRLSATADSQLIVEFESLTPMTCLVEDETVRFLNGGICQIKASQQGNNQWFEAEPIVVAFNTGVNIYLPMIKK